MQTGTKRAIELIEECQRTQADFLNLGGIGLTEIPKEILKLEHLKRLNLGWYYTDTKNKAIFGQGNIDSYIDNKIQDYSILAKLKSLTHFDLNGTIQQDYSFLKELKNLTSLSLSSSNISDISFLSELDNLISVALNFNKIQDFSPLSSLKNLTSLTLEFNQIQSVLVLSELKCLTSLNLSNNQIKDISAIENLIKLKMLNLGRNKIENISILAKLQNLTELNLSSNKIRGVSVLADLKNLIFLNLNGNQIQDISFLKKMKYLSSLHILNNQIKNISFLVKFTNLTSLSLSDDKIRDYSFLKKMTSLTSLYLSSKNLQNISFLTCLTGLTRLHLNNSQIEDISVLAELTHLTDLDLSRNKIKDISALTGLTSLITLILSNNKIEDISVLATLPDLVILNLRNNKISNISYIKRLINLTTLSLEGNQINCFPKFPLAFPKLRNLHLSSNPILDFPQEIFNQGDCLADAKGWIKDIEQGGTVNNEMKMVLIGNGRVGKTCVIKRMVDNEYSDSEKSTHAIQIRNLNQTLQIKNIEGNKQETDCTIRIWDFGGQDIYHSTHRYFMQSRALILLVWDYATENNPTTESEAEKGVFHQNFKLTYWVDYINSLTKRSPVIIVQNKSDKHRRQPVENRAYLEQLSPQIVDYETVSAATGRGFEGLADLIKESYEKMPELGMPMPSSWYEVRKVIFERIEVLEKKKEAKQEIAPAERYFELEEFKSLCKEKKVSFNSTFSLLRYLHNTGWVFFQENLFNNRIIIDQAWAIRAVYTLFDREGVYFDMLKAYKGKFTMSTLKVVWQDNSEEERKLFLSLMESCELCFKVNKDEENPEYIAPQLLPQESPEDIDDLFKYGDLEVLHLAYYHPFLHQAIIHRFIVRAGHLSKGENIWFNGVKIRHQDTHALIEVVKKAPDFVGEQDQYSEDEKKIVQIRVTGPKSQELLSLIRKEFTKIHPDNMRPQEMISLNGDDWASYQDFTKAKRSGAKEITSVNYKVIEVADLEKFVLLEEPFAEERKQMKSPMIAAARPIEPMIEEREEFSLRDLAPTSEEKEDKTQQFLFIGDVAKDENRLWQLEEKKVMRGYFAKNSKVEWSEQEGVTPNTFQEILLQGKYDFLYFSGHSSEEGIHLLDDNGKKIVVGHLNTFRFADSLKCVIFCSCESENFAPEVGKYIPYVIAMKAEIRDKFAEAFAGGFSLGLSTGRSIEASFEIGLDRVQMNGLEGENIPVLYVRGKAYKK